jgi:phosphosulfolactate synthase
MRPPRAGRWAPRARTWCIATVTGGGPFEIAVAQGELPAYLDLCADIGVSGIECGEGFTDLPVGAEDIVRMACERVLEVRFELGKKRGGVHQRRGGRVDRARTEVARWRSDPTGNQGQRARGVGLFYEKGELNFAFADRFVAEFGPRTVIFEAPTKPDQFALIDHFGYEVCLSNVRLEELLRVEIYRRGLHSDAFLKLNLRPRKPL